MTWRGFLSCRTVEMTPRRSSKAAGQFFTGFDVHEELRAEETCREVRGFVPETPKLASPEPEMRPRRDPTTAGSFQKHMGIFRTDSLPV